MKAVGHPQGRARSGGPARATGWLRLLCWMLVVVGPALSVLLWAERYAAIAPSLPGSLPLQAALGVASGTVLAAIAYGVRAGLALWRLRPGAVAMSKRALVLGLVADAVSAVVEVAAAANDVAGSPLMEIEWRLLPGLVFFVAGYAYLDRSRQARSID